MGKPKKSCPKPKFETLHINNWDDYGWQEVLGAPYKGYETSGRSITKYIKKLAIVRNGGGRSVLQGLYLAAEYAKYRSAEMMNARDLILSDSAPKNKLIYQNTMVFGLH